MFPTPWTVVHHPYISDARDEYNTPVAGWADPGTPQRVYGWAPPGADTEENRNRAAVVHDLDLYTPTGFAGPLDRVDVDGRMYEVVGFPEDYNHGPFGFTPGYRINLKVVVESG